MRFSHQIFGYLHCVEGCSLTNLVATEPEGHAMLIGKVFPYAPHEDVVLACCVERHRIDAVGRVVAQATARGGGYGCLHLFHAQGALGLYPYAFRVGTEGAHPHASG